MSLLARLLFLSAQCCIYLQIYELNTEALTPIITYFNETVLATVLKILSSVDDRALRIEILGYPEGIY